MRSSSKSEPHKTLVEALDYRRSTPLVKYRKYVNNPTISAGSPIVKIITRSILEIEFSASSGQYSICWMKPYGVIAIVLAFAERRKGCNQIKLENLRREIP